MQPYKYCPYCKDELEIKHIDGRDRGQCKSCSWINYRNPLPAVACLIEDNDNRLLLIKRGIEPYKGEWGLPGGFIEIDETVAASAIRELYEETGVTAKAVKQVGAFIDPSQMYDAVVVIGFVLKADKFDLTPGDDAVDAKFFNMDDLPELVIPSHKVILRDYLEL
jgi:8-oxo-dGTP diphosphatase